MVIDKHLKEKIELRAHEIYEWRQANNVPGNATTDWFEAQEEVIADRRTNFGCPKCGFPMLARNNEEIFCLKNECDYREKAKRDSDKDIPKFSDIKKDWQ
jgi:predicted RNA-binding Zn-ribbon protein involved in translation (DUF1610 family)